MKFLRSTRLKSLKAERRTLYFVFALFISNEEYWSNPTLFFLFELLSTIYEYLAHINGLEGFWAYFKRKLAAKGGIRQSLLHLYLGGYVWRKTHRYLKFYKTRKLLNQILKKYIR